jgi:hypothetical protein
VTYYATAATVISCLSIGVCMVFFMGEGLNYVVRLTSSAPPLSPQFHSRFSLLIDFRACFCPTAGGCRPFPPPCSGKSDPERAGTQFWLPQVGFRLLPCAFRLLNFESRLLSLSVPAAFLQVIFILCIIRPNYQTVFIIFAQPSPCNSKLRKFAEIYD